jgi:hypothetical protein
MDNLAYTETDNEAPVHRVHWLGSVKYGLDAAKHGGTLYLPHYTYRDYKKWPQDFRCELIDGQVYMMASPSTRERDLTLKKERYLEAGVREYWIIDPEKRNLTVCLLREIDGKQSYEEREYQRDEELDVAIFNGALRVNLAELFSKAERYYSNLI